MENITNEPQFIIINGSSSSGKTSTAQALRKELSDKYRQLSSDEIVRTLPHCLSTDGVITQLTSRLNQQIKTTLENNERAIIDIVYGLEDMNDLCTSFGKANYFNVALAPPLDVLERREKNRNNNDKREIGHAARQFRVHTGIKYHLVIDNSQLTATQTAQEILKNFTGNCQTPKQTVKYN